MHWDAKALEERLDDSVAVGLKQGLRVRLDEEAEGHLEWGAKIFEREMSEDLARGETASDRIRATLRGSVSVGRVE